MMQTYPLPITDILYQRVQDLKTQGIDPYPTKFVRTHLLSEVNELYEGVGYDYEGEVVAMKLCGRVMDIQRFNSRLLVTVEDQEGRLQLILDPKDVDEDEVQRFEAKVYRGDYVGFEVDYIYREQGCITGKITRWHFLALCLLPLPRRITNPDQAYRQRYLQLAAEIEVRDHFTVRSKILQFTRRFLEDRYGFLEVSTPLLQPTSESEPIEAFTTYVSAANTHATLRGTSERYLNYLVLGGLERIYEMSHGFQNQPSTWQDYPESQVMQCRMMLADTGDLMRLTEQLLVGMTTRLNATRIIPWQSFEQIRCHAQERAAAEADWTDMSADLIDSDADDILIDLVPPWSRRSVEELTQDITGIDFCQIETIEEAAEAARAAGVDLSKVGTLTCVHDVLMETVNQLVGPGLIQPTFLVDGSSPRNPTSEPQRASAQSTGRFQLYINGLVFAEGSNEGTDPGEYTGQDPNDGYWTALKYGMPPVGALAIYMDRVVMLMTGALDIRDVIYFPLFHRARS